MAVAVLEPRRCSDCKAWKLFEFFYVKSHHNGKPRYDTSCKLCRNARTKVYQSRPENVTKVLEYKRRHYHRVGKLAIRNKAYKKFNANAAAYDVQLQQQNGTCAICLRAPAHGENLFAFDHDHQTGLARGVLCPACNAALGCLRDRPALLLAALRYLEYWVAQHDIVSGTHGV